MKKKAAILLAVWCIFIFAGCGADYDVEASTLFVDEDGKVTCVSVEEFDKEYYDEEELESYVDDMISDYHTENGEDKIEKTDFEVKDGVAKLQLTYAAAEDYSRFNGVECFAGTLPEAMAAGYDFTDSYSSVLEGEIDKAVSRDEFLDNPDLKVMIIKEGITVVIPGEIKYVSGNVLIMDDDSVRPTEEFYLQDIDTAITVIYE